MAFHPQDQYMESERLDQFIARATSTRIRLSARAMYAERIRYDLPIFVMTKITHQGMSFIYKIMKEMYKESKEDKDIASIERLEVSTFTGEESIVDPEEMRKIDVNIHSFAIWLVTLQDTIHLISKIISGKDIFKGIPEFESNSNYVNTVNDLLDSFSSPEPQHVLISIIQNIVNWIDKCLDWMEEHLNVEYPLAVGIFASVLVRFIRGYVSVD